MTRGGGGASSSEPSPPPPSTGNPVPTGNAMPLLRTLSGVLLSLALASCCSPVGSAPPTAVGSYALASLNERPLPAPAVCGGFQVLGGEVVLDGELRATYSIRQRENATGKETLHRHEGSFRQEGKTVVLTLREEGSGAPVQMHAEVAPGLLTFNRRAPCDGWIVEVFRAE